MVKGVERRQLSLSILKRENSTNEGMPSFHCDGDSFLLWGTQMGGVLMCGGQIVMHGSC